MSTVWDNFYLQFLCEDYFCLECARNARKLSPHPTTIGGQIVRNSTQSLVLGKRQNWAGSRKSLETRRLLRRHDWRTCRENVSFHFYSFFFFLFVARLRFELWVIFVKMASTIFSILRCNYTYRKMRTRLAWTWFEISAIFVKRQRSKFFDFTYFLLCASKRACIWKYNSPT